MKPRYVWKQRAQLVVVLLCAGVVKLYYSTASVNQLRWILAPTSTIVEFVSNSRFEFESYAGYINSDRSFVIAASCAGVNFLITSFLMLSLRELWRDRSRNISWAFIPVAALFAYVATVTANTVRISTALRLRQMSFETSWLSPSELHRLEGIVIYFGFLLLLFLLNERLRTGKGSDRTLSVASNSFTRAGKHDRLLKQALFPLFIYYATTLGVPLANGAFRRGFTAINFWEHLGFVLLIPLVLIIPLVVFRFINSVREADEGIKPGA
jgi:exosortase K